MRITVVIPVFQDWDSFERLVSELDYEIASAGALGQIEFHVLAVDDGSADQGPVDSPVWPTVKRISRIEVLRIALNMGHQRAIALGAVHVVNSGLSDAVVIMDADGEDSPSDVVRLVEAHLHSPRDIILARRAERSEPLAFRMGYQLYRVFFRLLTGQGIHSGNFCLVPHVALARLVCNCDIWNHFAAAVGRSRLSVTMVATSRGVRYAGRSHMNWVALAIHGLSAMSVHSDRIATRLILVSVVVMAVSVVAILGVIGVRFLTDLAIPGWASQVVGTLALASLVSVGIAAQLAFTTLQTRQGVQFMPTADGSRYIRQVELWHPKNAAATLAKS